MTKRELVVKTNRLNEAMHNLELIETRLIHMGIVRFRENPIFSADTKVIISANDYANLFDVDRVSAHQALIEAEKVLFSRQFTIINNNGNREKSRWIQSVEYMDGENALGIRFATLVVDCISRIDGNDDPFTSYYLEQIAPLKSRYAVRLYELIKQWLTARKTPLFELEKFRYQLGLLPHEYKRINNFKARVLDIAMREINEKTDLTITCHQEKKGRVVAGFWFEISEKKILKDKNDKKSNLIERDPDTADMFIKLTDKQLARIVHSKKFINDYNGLVSAQNPANQSSSAWVAHMVAWLKKDPDNFTKRPMQEYLDDEQAIRF